MATKTRSSVGDRDRVGSGRPASDDVNQAPRPVMLGPTRRAAILGAGASGMLLAAPAIARGAAQEYKIFQILFRGPTDGERGFSDYLRSRGLQIEYIVRNADRDPAEVPGFVAEGRTHQPDLWYTWGTPVTIATFGRWNEPHPERYVTKAPGLFTMVSTPVASGVVSNLQQPDRNITGVFHIVPIETQLRFIRTYRPFKTLGVVYTPTEQNSVTQVEQIRALQDEMGFELVARAFPLDANGMPVADALDGMIADIKAAGADYLLVPADTFLTGLADQLRATTVAHNVLPFAFTEFAMRRGMGAAGLVARYYLLGQLAGQKAERILVEKAPPGDIPVQTLQRFSLMINVAFAKELNAYPPLSLVDSAEFIDA